MSRLLYTAAGLVTLLGIILFIAPAGAPGIAHQGENGPQPDTSYSTPELDWPDRDLTPLRSTQPLPAEQVVAQPVPPRDVEIILLGITRQGSRSLAWMRVDSLPARGFSVGDRVDRWEIVAIDQTSVELVSDSEARTFALFR